MIEFLTNNWPIISAVLVAGISEILAIYPKTKYNGVLHVIVELLKKKK